MRRMKFKLLGIFVAEDFTGRGSGGGSGIEEIRKVHGMLQYERRVQDQTCLGSIGSMRKGKIRVRTKSILRRPQNRDMDGKDHRGSRVWHWFEWSPQKQPLCQQVLRNQFLPEKYL